MAAISSYRNYESEARDLVHSLLVTCLKEVSKEDIALQEDVQWPPADQFTVESGKSCIEQLIKSWDLDNSWLHYISYSGINELGLHCYTVMFSQPSRSKPVPRSTATVTFYILANDIDKTSPVKTFYILEGSRVVLRAGMEEFKEVWLKNVIDSKLVIVGGIDV